MNREILFRGKRIDDGTWEYGSLVRFADSTCEILVPENDVSLRACTVIEESCGQYTGLTDKNGTRIFEGDIISSHYVNAVKPDHIDQVVFHNGKFCGYTEFNGGKWWAPLPDGVPHFPHDESAYMDICVVIGNIHDNPELLERETP